MMVTILAIIGGIVVLVAIIGTIGGSKNYQKIKQIEEIRNAASRELFGNIDELSDKMLFEEDLTQLADRIHVYVCAKLMDDVKDSVRADRIENILQEEQDSIQNYLGGLKRFMLETLEFESRTPEILLKQVNLWVDEYSGRLKRFIVSKGISM